MDLWIRSQDKEKLVKVTNISYIDASENYKEEVHTLWNVSNGILGTYKTKERALKVLDEIENAILGIITDEEVELQNVREYTGTVVLSKVTHSIVYQMPEE